MKLFTALFSVAIFSSSLFAQDIAWKQYQQGILFNLPKVEGWCTKEKATRMMDLIHERVEDENPICVEVGVFGGSSFYPTVAALEYNKRGIGYAIDPWTNAACTTGLDGVNHDWWSKVDLRKIMIGFIDLMHTQKLDGRYCLMRMTSAQAAAFFQDQSISVLHIDGNHSDESALYDAMNWLPKVKVGGYIWFDDANWSSTTRAVQYLLQQCELDPTSKEGDPFMLFRKIS